MLNPSIFRLYIQNIYKISELTYFMTNITLSIDDSTYKKMKKHSEIRWSEYVRKSIQKRISELEKIDILEDSVATMLASENVLKEEWDNEEDDRWNDV